MPRRNQRDEITGRRGTKARRRGVSDFQVPQACPCWDERPCPMHNPRGG